MLNGKFKWQMKTQIGHEMHLSARNPPSAAKRKWGWCPKHEDQDIILKPRLSRMMIIGSLLVMEMIRMEMIRMMNN